MPNVSPGSGEALTPRYMQPVVAYSYQGQPIPPQTVVADGSTLTAGSNGTARATAANPLNVAVNGANGTGLATSANPLPTVVNGVTSSAVASATNPVPTRGYGWPTLTTGQVSVATTNTQVVAARAGRGVVRVTNHGTNPVYLGNTGVAVGTGFLLPGIIGATVEIPTPAALFGIAGVAQTVSFIELY